MKLITTTKLGIIALAAFGFTTLAASSAEAKPMPPKGFYQSRAGAAAQFRALDKNHNGVLSRADFLVRTQVGTKLTYKRQPSYQWKRVYAWQTSYTWKRVPTFRLVPTTKRVLTWKRTKRGWKKVYITKRVMVHKRVLTWKRVPVRKRVRTWKRVLITKWVPVRTPVYHLRLSPMGAHIMRTADINRNGVVTFAEFMHSKSPKVRIISRR